MNIGEYERISNLEKNLQGKTCKFLIARAESIQQLVSTGGFGYKDIAAYDTSHGFLTIHSSNVTRIIKSAVVLAEHGILPGTLPSTSYLFSLYLVPSEKRGAAIKAAQGGISIKKFREFLPSSTSKKEVPEVPEVPEVKIPVMEQILSVLPGLSGEELVFLANAITTEIDSRVVKVEESAGIDSKIEEIKAA